MMGISFLKSLWGRSRWSRIAIVAVILGVACLAIWAFRARPAAAYYTAKVDRKSVV